MSNQRKKAAKEFWDRGFLITTKNKQYRKYVEGFFKSKIKRDTILGDITSETVIPRKKIVPAIIKAKEDTIVAGLEEITHFLKKAKVQYIALVKDGQAIKKGKTIVELRGNARTILKIERSILNVLQRMSGIATAANKLATKTKNNCSIAGTRKTILDIFDKKAISVGKGLTHRLNASDSVLIKENHLTTINNNIDAALKNAVKAKTNYIEIEVKNEKEALQAAKTMDNLKTKKQFAIMFDNMPPAAIKNTIQKIKKSKRLLLFEASGGITEKSIAAYSKTGVDCISLGSLTHSVKASDFSLLIQ